MSAMINSVLTNQFFLMFLAIATGLLIGKIKIGSFSLGVSGGIFTGIVIGYFVTKWAHTVEEGQKYYSTAKRILSTGVVAQAFFTFFLLLFLVSIGMKVGGSIGAIFKKYGSKFVVIGVSIPVVSLIAACVLYGTVLSGNEAITPFETIGMYAGAMTTTPGYGTALDAAGQVDYKELYENYSAEDKEKMLLKIDPSGSLTVEDTPSLNEEQVAAYKEAAASSISLGYTVAFPIGVLVIVVMETLLPKVFRIDMEKEREKYQKELEENMEELLDIVVLGRACRNTANIKNRQPIGTMYVKAEKKMSEFYTDIIADELNVKEVKFADDVESFISYSFKPQLRTVGPKYGKLLGGIRQALTDINGTAAMNELRTNGVLKLDINGNDVELTEEDLLIETAQTEGYVSESDGETSVVLDTNLTPELIEEGFVREIISKIQTMRKEAGFEVMDKIVVYAHGNDKIQDVMKAHEDEIKSEVLADEMVLGETDGYVKEWNINKEAVTMGVKKL